MMIVVLDEEWYAKKKLQDNRKWMLTDVFKFYKEDAKNKEGAILTLLRHC
jgi:hypothetical protein